MFSPYSSGLDGMVRIDGDLDPETGETLLTALGAVLDSDARSRTEEDTRSPAQRRAENGGLCHLEPPLHRVDPIDVPSQRYVE